MDRRQARRDVATPSFRLLRVFLACTSACVDRTHPHSDLGHQLALHLCPVHDQCGCEAELLIPDCEARVERELVATERRALEAGLELDQAGFLGECAEGLLCDSDDTRTCVPSPYWPLVPTGGACTSPISCVNESYCHTDDPEGPSEEVPGICTVRTPEGRPCDNLLECTTICTDGICETQPVRMCEALEAWWARAMF